MRLAHFEPTAGPLDQITRASAICTDHARCAAQ